MAAALNALPTAGHYLVDNESQAPPELTLSEQVRHHHHHPRATNITATPGATTVVATTTTTTTATATIPPPSLPPPLLPLSPPPQPMTIDLHPSDNVLGAGLIDGTVRISRFAADAHSEPVG